MSKSIIGYYSEPLTQQERDEVYNITHPIFLREHSAAVVNSLGDLAHTLIRNKDGILFTGEQLTILLTDELQNKIRDDQKYKDIPPECLKSLEIKPGKYGSVYLSMSEEMSEYFNFDKLIPLPFDYSSSEGYAVNRTNQWLSDNPDKRIFDKTEKALLVDKLNTAILQKLETCGYQSEISRPIYDFSPEILKSLN